MKKIKFVRLDRDFAENKKKFFEIINKIGKTGNFILGKEVENFEKKIKKLLNSKYVLAVSNATDGLILSLKAIGIKENDEVLVPVNSFISSASSVVACGAIPRFVDICACLNINFAKIEKKITKKTKAIMPVHFAGKPAIMSEIIKIAKKYKLKIIEDCAQAVGGKYKNKFVGTLGDIGCFSMHPLKNLNVYGDGGFITTNNKKYFKIISKLRNHGLEGNQRDNPAIFGYNNRLDEIQAGLANLKLRKLNSKNKKIIKIARLYNKSFSKFCITPNEDKESIHVYHRYIIQVKNRDNFIKYMKKKKIDCKIHYPKLLSEIKAYQKFFMDCDNFNESKKINMNIVSLPNYSELKKDEVNYVINKVVKYFKIHE